jgi:hypothetical protein
MKTKSLLFIAMPFLLLSCMKDTVQESYSFYRPVYQTKESIKNGIKNLPAEDIQQPGKIVLKGNYLFLNDIDRGIHIIDLSDPTNPKKLSFIDIPGSIDLAVNGNYLYADCYTDLVTLDITDPQNVTVKQFINGVFPHRYYGNFLADTTQVIRKWVKVDTSLTKAYTGRVGQRIFFERSGMFFSPASGFLASSISGTAAIGIAGSTARFGLQQKRMYTVSHDDLKVFNVTKPDAPVYTNKVDLVQGNIETIFPYKNNLFIGAQGGMFIYSASNPDQPSLLGQFTHVRSCDPVVADDTHAYVTLSGGTMCGGFSNQLDVVDIKNLLSPKLLKTYSLKSPKGLSKDGNILLICDGTDGLKLFDVSDPINVTHIKTLSGFEPHDVIAIQGYAIVVASDGIYTIDYRQPANAGIIGKIVINKN